MIRAQRRNPSIACAVAILLGIACSSLSQIQPIDTAAQDNKDTPAGVSVPDSPGAVERLDKAKEKESQKQWKIAAEFYQEALGKYPARVVPVQIDKTTGIFRYSGVAPIIQERIARWPDEGLTIYRNLYGQTAADLLASARRGDVSTLRAVFWDYFVTDAGKTAGVRLIDNYMETGDFSAAAWVGDRLLKLHPSLGGDRAMVIYRTAIASHWGNDDDRASALLAELKNKNANDIGTIGGKDVLLVDALAAALAAPAPRPTTRPADADTWPSFNGIDGRGDLSTSIAKPGASLNSVEMAQPDPMGLIGAQKGLYETQDKLAITNNQAMGVMPVVDGGSLFFQDGRCVYAVNADTGLALPGWLNTYSGERNGHYRMSVFGRARNEELTLTVAPTAVLAVMGQPDRASANGNFPPAAQNSSVKLVCLDRETGRELWTKSPADLPITDNAIRSADYVGTPLVIPASSAGHPQGMLPATAAPDDSVLVLARGGKDQQFDNCYLVSLSLRTGQYQWSTYVGSATRSFEIDGLGSQDPSQMAFASGRVFVLSNLGSVAALDPADGRVIWLSSYERDTTENFDPWRGRGRRFNGEIATDSVNEKPWARNPVFVSNGRIFVLPTDAHKVLVFNAGSGALEKAISTSNYGNADVLLGVRDDALVLTSDQALFWIDWKKFNGTDPDSAVRWKNDNLTGNYPEKSHPNVIYGRGFMTADSIFVPSQERLYQISWPRRRIVATYPTNGTFTDGEGPGNVLVTAQNVIIAGQTRVDAYTDLKMVRDRYEQEMTASPTDPEPRVRFAEVLYAGGQTTDALAHVDEAINIVGGISAMRSGKDRDLIFTTLLDFARQTEAGADKETDGDKKTARIAFGDQLFDRAGAAADSPFEKATYRLTRARIDHENHKYTEEVTLCQEILSDDAMRLATIAENGTAGDAAEAAIGVVVDLDRAIYRPIEALAQTAKEKALAANDPEQLLAVGAIYPNSQAASQARQAAVDRFEATHDPARAIDIQRQMYSSLVDPRAKAERLTSITNDFLALHEIGPAIDRLARAARVSPDQQMTSKLDLPDGTSLLGATYAQAVATLRAIAAKDASAKLPDFNLGTPAGATDPGNPFVTPPVVIEGVTTVAHPLRDYPRNDQILTWSAAGLAIYPAGQTAPLATVADVKDTPQGAAWTGEKWIVWTSTDLFAITGDGKLLWTLSISKLPTLLVSNADDAVVDEHSDQDPDNVAINGGVNNIRIVQNGQVIMVNAPGKFVVRGGRMVRVAVPAVVAPAPAPDAVLMEQIVAVQPAGTELLLSTSTGRILAINSTTGEILWQTRTADHAVDQLLANGHFTIARIDDLAGSQVVVYDTRTGRVIGRRLFSGDSTPGQLVNVALSEEATLAFTLLNRVVVKDLYDAWKIPPAELGAHLNQDTSSFVGLNLPNQLLVNGGRLVCLYDNGRYMRGFDLIGSVEPTMPLNTGSDSPTDWMQMVGPRVFVVRTSGMKQYNLADAHDHNDLETIGLSTQLPKIRTMLLGKDEAILLDEHTDRGPAGSAAVTILAYSRALVPGKTIESGKLDYMRTATSRSGIIDWLGVDGGIYYQTKDGKLRFLRGGRPR